MAWTKLLVCLLLSAPLSLCHPGEEEKIYQHAARPLHHRTPHIYQCKAALREPEFVMRTIKRRQTEVKRLRKERGLESRALPLHKRQLDKLKDILNKDHQVKKPFNKDTNAAELFTDDSACIMGTPCICGQSQGRKGLFCTRRSVSICSLLAGIYLTQRLVPRKKHNNDIGNLCESLCIGLLSFT